MRRGWLLWGCVMASGVAVSGAAAWSTLPDRGELQARAPARTVAPANPAAQAAHAAARHAPAPAAWTWTIQASGVSARLRGVSAVSARVAWASGADGTILRTTDGGATWQPRPVSVPGAGALDFRDVDAIDERTASALSIGPGEASRIFKTVDGGATWQAQFVNADPKAFLDAMAFANADNGIVIGDAVDGAHFILRTSDGGRAWTRIPPASLPPALPGEGAFAASGTNVATWGRAHIWIATNAPGPDAASPGRSRVLRSRDGGRTWAVSNTPLAAGASAGIFSIAFRDARHGVIVGGDYKKEGEAVDNVAVTSDGGVTWTRVRGPHGLSGFRSVVAYVPRAGKASASASLVAVGPSGADLSIDDGRTWRPLPPSGGAAPGAGEGFHAFSFAPGAAVGWGVGEKGRIARLSLTTQP